MFALNVVMSSPKKFLWALTDHHLHLFAPEAKSVVLKKLIADLILTK